MYILNAIIPFLLRFVFFLNGGKYKHVKDPRPLSEYVNPNIGSALSRWFFYTPAAVAFGMAKLAPSTNAHYGNIGGWEATGYDPRDSSIEGFACFHEFQIGGIVLPPSVGELQTVRRDLNNPDKGYRSRFNKKEDYATLGYYSVLPKNYHVKVELTPTKKVGFQRYTFPKSEESNIIFDIRNRQLSEVRLPLAEIKKRGILKLIMNAQPKDDY